MNIEQLTIADAEREWHIARLSRSMERWRASGLNERLPDEYARHMAMLDCLCAGEPYQVRRIDPMAWVMSTAPIGRSLDSAPDLVADIVMGFARSAVRSGRDKRFSRERNT